MAGIPKFLIAIIEDLSIVAAKLAPNSVLTSKIADLAVTAPKLADAAVTTDKLNDEAVTLGKLDPAVQAALGVTSALVSKTPVRFATQAAIANPATGAPDTLDGGALQVGDRVGLFTGPGSFVLSGLYQVDVVGTGADGQWSRTTDADSAGDLFAGVEVYVQEGDTFAKTRFTLTTPGTISIGATPLEWVPGGAIVQSDTLEQAIGTVSAPISAAAATPSPSDVLDCLGYSHVILMVDLGANPGATELKVAARFSGKAAPNKASPPDWIVVPIDDLDRATGDSVLRDYSGKYDVTGVTNTRLKPIRVPVMGRWFTGAAWVSAGPNAGTTAAFAAYRVANG